MGTEIKLELKFCDNRANGFRVIEFLVFFQYSCRRPSWIFKFKMLTIFSYSGCVVDDSNRFDVIAIFVNFNRRPAAILDFEKFHFWPQNHLRGGDTKLGLKFGDNRSNIFGVIEFLVFYKMAASGHLW